MRTLRVSDLKLSVGIARHDRREALFDGTVKFVGVDATFHSGRIVTDMLNG